MGMTIVEKILARKSGKEMVRPGEIVVCEVDTIVLLDLRFALGDDHVRIRKVHDPSKVAVILDHAIPAPTVGHAIGHSRAREFAEKFKIGKFFDIGEGGICHQVIAENGLALPGEILMCSDSHTCAAGAFNNAARGLGAAELTQVLCTGETWYRVPPTVKFELVGERPDRVSGKDIFLAIAGRYGALPNRAIEFGGPGIASIPVDERRTIATQGAELSADYTLFPADKLLADYFEDVADRPFEPANADENASYDAVHEVNLSDLVPMVARPGRVDNNTAPAAEFDDVQVDQCFIGSCANGKLSDLAEAARILKGKRVAKGVRLIVTPASHDVYREAARQGIVATLADAGAVVTNSTCGACYGGHLGVVGPNEVCITASTRNFKGRMGSADAEIYMASAATVAATAVTGHITDAAALES